MSFLVRLRAGGGADVLGRQYGPVSSSAGRPDSSPHLCGVLTTGPAGVSPAVTCGVVLASAHHCECSLPFSQPSPGLCTQAACLFHF